MYACLLDPADPPALSALEEIARACSPRVERDGGRAVIVDLDGLDRLFGSPTAMAVELERLAAAHGVAPRLAIAGTRTAASLLAQGRAATTIVPAGEEAAAVAPLKLELIECRAPSPCGLAILHRWGLRTLGDLARLPEAEVRTRLGDLGARWHRAARGEDAAPLVPVSEPVRFARRLDLEWPVEGLEPLSFILSRLCESLSDQLERADRGAVAVTTRLRLVTRATHERTLGLPAPMRDPRVLRTLILLDLESHPPAAGIDIVDLELGVTPGRIVQGSLLARSVPSPESLATLIARLRALMGESRVGAPALVDTHDERAVGMGTFTGEAKSPKPKAKSEAVPGPSAQGPGPAVRRFRLPLVVSVEAVKGTPIRVRPVARSLAGGRVLACAGPWRSSGGWWRDAWDRDLWDVELADGVFRLCHDRAHDRWEIEGTVD